MALEVGSLEMNRNENAVNRSIITKNKVREVINKMKEYNQIQKALEIKEKVRMNEREKYKGGI